MFCRYSGYIALLIPWKQSVLRIKTANY